jgi:uncharacterized membrane protein YdjX (TVP38/TMEM64 family)
MNEIFPVIYGVGVGLACSFLTSPRWRYGLWILLSALFGIVATVVTGEWKISWEFLLIDIPLVAASSFAVMALRNRIRRRRRAR